MRLFETEEVLPDLAGEEAPGNDEASRELFEEVERTLQVFRETAHTHTWLGEAGLNADRRQLEEADRARAGGGDAESVDLTRFVADAIHFDGGQVTGSPADQVFSVTLPPAWRYGLDDMPGYDPDTNTVVLTTDLEVTSHNSRPVGFLGRAHPLVRRALERVRSLTYGSAADSYQDHRVSAVRADVREPEMLLTFLGRLESRSGPELERVLAVRATQSGDPEVVEPEEWTRFAAPENGIQPTDLWKTMYSTWGEGVQVRAREAAEAYFKNLSDDLTSRRHVLLGTEARELAAWLRQRAIEITSNAEELDTQAGLFADPGTEVPAPPAWRTLPDPAERLAGLESDRKQPMKLRNQARVVLELYQRRQKDLTGRMALLPPSVIPLGILMLLPEGSIGA
jgi:hypothetical protein